MNPFVGPALAHPKDLRDDLLKRIDLEVKKDEEQLVFDGDKTGFTSPAIASLARCLVPIVFAHIGIPSLCKGNQERVKFLRVQAGEGAQNAGIVFEAVIGEHRTPFRLIGLKVSGDIGSPA